MKDSMWFFQKISLGLTIVNGLLLALADNKMTAQEIMNLINVTLQGLGLSGNVTGDAFQVVYEPDGSITVKISKELVDKINFSI